MLGPVQTIFLKEFVQINCFKYKNNLKICRQINYLLLLKFNHINIHVLLTNMCKTNIYFCGWVLIKINSVLNMNAVVRDKFV